MCCTRDGSRRFFPRRLRDRGSHSDCPRVCAGGQGFLGYDLSVLWIRYLVPRMCVCVVFSRSAILRIEGCLNRSLESAQVAGMKATSRTTPGPSDPECRNIAKSRECLGHHRKGTTGIGSVELLFNVG